MRDFSDADVWKVSFLLGLVLKLIVPFFIIIAYQSGFAYCRIMPPSLPNCVVKKSGVLSYDCYRLKGALIFEKLNRTRIHLILFSPLSVNFYGFRVGVAETHFVR